MLYGQEWELRRTASLFNDPRHPTPKRVVQRCRLLTKNASKSGLLIPGDRLIR